MSLLPNRSICAVLSVVAPPALLAAAAGVLFFFPPAQVGFYPRCPIYTAFAVQCPGCGGTRALSALLHGRLGEAFHDNALIFLLLPLVFGYGSRCYLRLLREQFFCWPRLPPPILYGLSIAAVIFTIVRNLPLG